MEGTGVEEPLSESHIQKGVEDDHEGVTTTRAPLRRRRFLLSVPIEPRPSRIVIIIFDRERLGVELSQESSAAAVSLGVLELDRVINIM